MIDHCNYDLIDFIDHSPADSFLRAALKPTLHVFQIPLFNNNDNIWLEYIYKFPSQEQLSILRLFNLR